MKPDEHSHWNHIYATEPPDEVSWTQAVPQTSLDFIRSFAMPKTAKIIDVGGGDSKLVDFLVEGGYENITVLDISEKGIEKAKNRLGRKAQQVNWIVSDITDFKPGTSFDIWHDRATFHFLTGPEQISDYKSIVKASVTRYLVLGTFSINGPDKCSGLPVQQYSEKMMCAEFDDAFEKLKCVTEDHPTPFGTIQKFLFCGFKRRL